MLQSCSSLLQSCSSLLAPAVRPMKPGLAVEQDDVIGVDLGAGREQVHGEQVPWGRDVDDQRVTWGSARRRARLCSITCRKI